MLFLFSSCFRHFRMNHDYSGPWHPWPVPSFSLWPQESRGQYDRATLISSWWGIIIALSPPNCDPGEVLPDPPGLAVSNLMCLQVVRKVRVCSHWPKDCFYDEGMVTSRRVPHFLKEFHWWHVQPWWIKYLEASMYQVVLWLRYHLQHFRNIRTINCVGWPKYSM